MRQWKSSIRSIVWISVLIVGFQKNAEGFVTLTPSLSASERYTDNLFFKEKDRESDFITMLSPQITLAYSDRDFSISGRYEGNAEFHRRHPETNRYGQSVFFDLNVPFLSRLVKGVDIRITENVTYSPELPSFSYDGGVSEEIPREGNEGIQVGRVDTFRNRTGISIGYSWTPRLSGSLSYSNLINRYQGRGFQDYLTHGVGLGGAFQASRSVRWTAFYSTSVTHYEEAESVTVHQVGIGNVYQAAPTVSMSIDTGAAFPPEGGTQWILSTALVKSAKLSSLSFRYNQQIGRGGGVTTTATLSQNLVASLSRTTGKSSSIYLQLGYGQNRTLSGPVVKISSQEIGTGIQFALFSWLNGGINYNYLNQRTEGESPGDVSRNQVVVSLTAVTLPWRIIQ
jgi:hypothetical protein